jgi:hypothetical protein
VRVPPNNDQASTPANVSNRATANAAAAQAAVDERPAAGWDGPRPGVTSPFLLGVIAAAADVAEVMASMMARAVSLDS